MALHLLSSIIFDMTGALVESNGVPHSFRKILLLFISHPRKVVESRLVHPAITRASERAQSTMRGREETRRSSSISTRSDAISPKSRAHSKNRKRTASERGSLTRGLQQPPSHNIEPIGDVAWKPFVLPQIPAKQSCHSRPSTPSYSGWESLLGKKSSTATEVFKPSNPYAKPRDSRYGSLVAVETVKWDCSRPRSDSEATGLPVFKSDMRRPSQAEGCIEMVGPTSARHSLANILDRPTEYHEFPRLSQDETQIPDPAEHGLPITQYGSVSTVSTTKFPLNMEDTCKIPIAPPTLVTPIEALLETQHEQHRSLNSPMSINSACEFCIQEQKFLQQCLQTQRRSEDLIIQREAERRKHVYARLRLKRRLKRWAKWKPSPVVTSLWLATNLVLVCSIIGCTYLAVPWQNAVPAAMISSLLFYVWLGFIYATHYIWGYWHALWLGLKPTMEDVLASDPERQPLIQETSKKNKKKKKKKQRRTRQGYLGESTFLRAVS